MSFKFRPSLTSLDSRLVPSTVTDEQLVLLVFTDTATVGSQSGPGADDSPVDVSEQVPPAGPPAPVADRRQQLLDEINRRSGELDKLKGDIKKAGQALDGLLDQYRKTFELMENETDPQQKQLYRDDLVELRKAIQGAVDNLNGLLDEYRDKYDELNDLRQEYLDEPDTSRQDLPWRHYSPDTPFWQLPDRVKRLIDPGFDKVPQPVPADPIG